MTDKEKKRQATIVRKFGSLEAFREIQRQGGRKGGKATGESKRRGDSEYYSRISKVGKKRGGEE